MSFNIKLLVTQSNIGLDWLAPLKSKGIGKERGKGGRSVESIANVCTFNLILIEEMTVFIDLTVIRSESMLTSIFYRWHQFIEMVVTMTFLWSLDFISSNWHVRMKWKKNSILGAIIWMLYFLHTIIWDGRIQYFNIDGKMTTIRLVLFSSTKECSS